LNQILEFVATLATSLFCGAAIYINVVEHPARMSCGTDVALTEFGPSYKRATVLQVSLAVTAFLASFMAWVLDSGRYWLLGSILIISVIPFTLLAILPTNKQLLSPALEKNSEHARELLIRWGKLHLVRSLLSFLSLLLFLLSLTG
jgi:hypothetical protein